jgi:hypothetical protein
MSRFTEKLTKDRDVVNRDRLYERNIICKILILAKVENSIG